MPYRDHASRLNAHIPSDNYATAAEWRDADTRHFSIIPGVLLFAGLVIATTDLAGVSHVIDAATSKNLLSDQ